MFSSWDAPFRVAVSSGVRVRGFRPVFVRLRIEEFGGIKDNKKERTLARV